MANNIGMMDAAYFVGRSEILTWINSTLHLNLFKVEEVCSDDDPSKPSDLRINNKVHSRDVDIKCGHVSMRLMGIFVVCLMVISVLFSVSVVLRDPPSHSFGAFDEARVLDVNSNKG